MPFNLVDRLSSRVRQRQIEKAKEKDARMAFRYKAPPCPICHGPRSHCPFCGYIEACEFCNSTFVICLEKDETPEGALEVNWHGTVESENAPVQTAHSTPTKE